MKPKIKSANQKLRRAEQKKLFGSTLVIIVERLLLLLSLAANIAQIWGPFWPAPPVFLPTAPGAGSPMSIPFQVENKSTIFSINNIKFECHIRNFVTKNNIKVDAITAQAGNSSSISAADSGFYVCPFDSIFRFPTGDEFVSAEISFAFEYDGILGRHTGESGVFTLDMKHAPPRWLAGKSLP